MEVERLAAEATERAEFEWFEKGILADQQRQQEEARQRAENERLEMERWASEKQVELERLEASIGPQVSSSCLPVTRRNIDRTVCLQAKKTIASKTLHVYELKGSGKVCFRCQIPIMSAKARQSWQDDEAVQDLTEFAKSSDSGGICAVCEDECAMNSEDFERKLVMFSGIHAKLKSEESKDGKEVVSNNVDDGDHSVVLVNENIKGCVADDDGISIECEDERMSSEDFERKLVRFSGIHATLKTDESTEGHDGVVSNYVQDCDRNMLDGNESAKRCADDDVVREVDEDSLKINEDGTDVLMEIQPDHQDGNAPSDIELTLRMRCRFCAMDITEYPYECNTEASSSSYRPYGNECAFCHVAKLGVVDESTTADDTVASKSSTLGGNVNHFNLASKQELEMNTNDLVKKRDADEERYEDIVMEMDASLVKRLDEEKEGHYALEIFGNKRQEKFGKPPVEVIIVSDGDFPGTTHGEKDAAMAMDARLIKRLDDENEERNEATEVLENVRHKKADKPAISSDQKVDNHQEKHTKIPVTKHPANVVFPCDDQGVIITNSGRDHKDPPTKIPEQQIETEMAENGESDMDAAEMPFKNGQPLQSSDPPAMPIPPISIASVTNAESTISEYVQSEDVLGGQKGTPLGMATNNVGIQSQQYNDGMLMVPPESISTSSKNLGQQNVQDMTAITKRVIFDVQSRLKEFSSKIPQSLVNNKDLDFAATPVDHSRLSSNEINTLRDSTVVAKALEPNLPSSADNAADYADCNHGDLEKENDEEVGEAVELEYKHLQSVQTNEPTTAPAVEIHCIQPLQSKFTAPHDFFITGPVDESGIVDTSQLDQSETNAVTKPCDTIPTHVMQFKAGALQSFDNGEVTSHEAILTNQKTDLELNAVASSMVSNSRLQKTIVLEKEKEKLSSSKKAMSVARSQHKDESIKMPPAKEIYRAAAFNSGCRHGGLSSVTTHRDKTKIVKSLIAKFWKRNLNKQQQHESKQSPNSTGCRIEHADGNHEYITEKGGLYSELIACRVSKSTVHSLHDVFEAPMHPIYEELPRGVHSNAGDFSSFDNENKAPEANMEPRAAVPAYTIQLKTEASQSVDSKEVTSSEEIVRNQKTGMEPSAVASSMVACPLSKNSFNFMSRVDPPCTIDPPSTPILAIKEDPGICVAEKEIKYVSTPGRDPPEETEVITASKTNTAPGAADGDYTKDALYAGSTDTISVIKFHTNQESANPAPRIMERNHRARTLGCSRSPPDYLNDAEDSIRERGEIDVGRPAQRAMERNNRARIPGCSRSPPSYLHDAENSIQERGEIDVGRPAPRAIEGNNRPRIPGCSRSSPAYLHDAEDGIQGRGEIDVCRPVPRAIEQNNHVRTPVNRPPPSYLHESIHVDPVSKHATVHSGGQCSIDEDDVRQQLAQLESLFSRTEETEQNASYNSRDKSACDPKQLLSMNNGDVRQQLAQIEFQFSLLDLEQEMSRHRSNVKGDSEHEFSQAQSEQFPASSQGQFSVSTSLGGLAIISEDSTYTTSHGHPNRGKEAPRRLSPLSPTAAERHMRYKKELMSRKKSLVVSIE